MARETVRIEGLAGVLQTLQQLPPEIVSKNGGPVKFGLKAAMKMMAAEVRQNLQQIINTPNAGGENESTGLLMQNVRDGRARLRGVKGEAHRVFIRNKRYPDKPVETQPHPGPGPKPVTTAQNARLLEYGNNRRPPMPFIRPAFEAKKNEAIDIFTNELKRRIALVQKRLARQNRVRA